MGDLENVTVLITCPECGRPTGPPVKGEIATVELKESTGRFIGDESLQVRDDLIRDLQSLLDCYRWNTRPQDGLMERMLELRAEHEKLAQADR